MPGNPDDCRIGYALVKGFGDDVLSAVPDRYNRVTQYRHPATPVLLEVVRDFGSDDLMPLGQFVRRPSLRRRQRAFLSRRAPEASVGDSKDVLKSRSVLFGE